MRRLCEEHVTTTSAYQIFEVVFFVCSNCILVEVKKMWSQAVFGKMSKSSHFFPGWEIYYLFKTRCPTKSPLEMGLILVFTKYPSGGCF